LHSISANFRSLLKLCTPLCMFDASTTFPKLSTMPRYHFFVPIGELGSFCLFLDYTDVSPFFCSCFHVDLNALYVLAHAQRIQEASESWWLLCTILHFQQVSMTFSSHLQAFWQFLTHSRCLQVVCNAQCLPACIRCVSFASKPHWLIYVRSCATWVCSGWKYCRSLHHVWPVILVDSCVWSGPNACEIFVYRDYRRLWTEEVLNHTCVGRAKAPGRYHKATVPPSPKITAGSLIRPEIVAGNLLRKVCSLSAMVPGSMDANDSASQIGSTPQSTGQRWVLEEMGMEEAYCDNYMW